MELLLILLLFVALCSLFYVLKPITNRQKLPLPPGSKGWPFIGETLEYHSMSKTGRIEKFLVDRMRKYNSKLFKTSYLGANVVFLCSAEGNKFLFSNENKLFKPWLPKIIENSVVSSEKITFPEELLSLRRIIGAVTEPNALKSYVGIMDAAAKKHLHMYWDGKEEVKAHSLTRKYIFSLVCKLLLNIHDSETADELGSLARCIMTEFFLIPINIPGTKFGRSARAARVFQQKIRAMIQQRKLELREKRAPECKDIISMLMLEKNKDGEDLTESEIALKTLQVLIASSDNPSMAITTIIKFLAEMPEIYEQVHREQTEIANSKAPDELLNFEDLKRMKYTWNVISEVLRMEPPNSGTFREALTDVNFNGYMIPKGWKLHWAVNATHTNPEYFPEPEKFDPSRFEKNELVPFSYVPFGAGPHICPGKEFARLEILIFFHNLIRRFKWEKVYPNEKMIRDPNLTPEKGLPILLYPYNL